MNFVLGEHPIGERILSFYFYFKFSFSDLRKSDRQISLGQTRKVLYATRATRGN